MHGAINTLHTLYHIGRADFLERTRRYGTLIVLGLTVYFTYIVLPPMDANYLSFNIGHARGIYNSAWVGSVVAVFSAIIFSFPALFLIKGTIERDRLTGVGQIIATTPLGKWHYTVGKFLSNFVFLAALAGVAMLVGVGMQLIRGEVVRINPWGYLGPYLLIALPMVALVAALAVLGESLSGLLGSPGKRAAPLLLGFCLLVTGGVLAEKMPYLYDGSEPAEGVPVDPTGVPIIFYSMWTAGRQQNPEFHSGLLIATLPNGMNINIARSTAGLPASGPGREGFVPRTFVWEGIAWTASAVLGRLVWFAVAFAAASVAALFFDRFDPATGQPPSRAGGAVVPAASGDPAGPPPMAAAATARLTPLPVDRRVNGAGKFCRVVISELRLMLHGVRWWWYTVTGGLILGGLLAPPDTGRLMLLPLAWAWPLLMWSPMGNRGARHNTQGMTFAAPLPIRRQLTACWTAGFVIALIAGSGVALRLMFAAQWSALLAWGVAALFIPSLALALGVWTGSSKTFEAIYLILWYLGPWNKIFYLDFAGTTGAAIEMGMPLYYFAITIVLLAAALVGRRRQF
jgi:hypothetical protein